MYLGPLGTKRASWPLILSLMDMVLGLYKKNWAKTIKNVQINNILRVSNILTHPVHNSFFNKVSYNFMLFFDYHTLSKIFQFECWSLRKEYRQRHSCMMSNVHPSNNAMYIMFFNLKLIRNFSMARYYWQWSWARYVGKQNLCGMQEYADGKLWVIFVAIYSTCFKDVYYI